MTSFYVHHPNKNNFNKSNARPYVPDRRHEEIPRPLDYDRPHLKEIPRPLDFDRRPSNEISRPFDYGDHRRPSIYGHPHHGQYDDTFDRRSYLNNQGHTGYSGTRSEDSFGYGGRYPSRRPVDDDFYNRNLPRYPKYPNRRIDHGPPHDIGNISSV